ncbi:MAG: hypothetical protein CR967_02280 [Proteobacteria bacterium]|nr:MAG: hypothetical protein CR967_02280 [Pseudomonadota bacterium]
MISYKKYGIKNFLKHNFKNAMMYFSLALQDKPEDKELHVYLSLANLAKSKKEDALSLFEFYRASLKSKSIKNSEDEMERIINSLDANINRLNFLFDQQELESFLLEENGITYVDFLDLLEKKGSFKRAFEDIMFSTKVLISKKEDFIHFLNLLVDNGFNQMALSYLESAVGLFPGDSSLEELANKFEETHT